MTNKKSCSGLVWCGYRNFACGRSGSYEHEGRHYCKTHHPPTIKAKLDDKLAKYDAAKAAERAAEREKEELIRKGRAFDALIAELRGVIINGNEGDELLLRSDIEAILANYEAKP